MTDWRGEVGAGFVLDWVGDELGLGGAFGQCFMQADSNWEAVISERSTIESHGQSGSDASVRRLHLGPTIKQKPTRV